MAIQKNNSDYGFSLQKLICDKYDLEVWGSAIGLFAKGYNSDYDAELMPLCEKIFKEVGTVPVKLLTPAKMRIKNRLTKSPHNFLLAFRMAKYEFHPIRLMVNAFSAITF